MNLEIYTKQITQTRCIFQFPPPQPSKDNLTGLRMEKPREVTHTSPSFRQDCYEIVIDQGLLMVLGAQSTTVIFIILYGMTRELPPTSSPVACKPYRITSKCLVSAECDDG